MAVSGTTLEGYLKELSFAATAEHDVPAETATAAVVATRAVFAQIGCRPLAVSERRRVKAYFGAVVRRRIIRDPGSRRAASRAVLAAVVADMSSAGCDADRIVAELERGWKGQVPEDVFEETRLRLVS